MRRNDVKPTKPRSFLRQGRRLCLLLAGERILRDEMKQQSQAQLKELERLLAFFDKDGDGNISAAELRLFLNTVRQDDISAEEAEAMIQGMEPDADGLLPLDQLVARLVEAEVETGAEVLPGIEESVEVEREEEKDLQEAFRMYESDGEGCITARSLKRMLSRLGMSMEMDQCRAMIRRFDTDGDGVLCFGEFKFMMTMAP